MSKRNNILNLEFCCQNTETPREKIKDYTPMKMRQPSNKKSNNRRIIQQSYSKPQIQFQDEFKVMPANFYERQNYLPKVRKIMIREKEEQDSKRLQSYNSQIAWKKSQKLPRIQKSQDFNSLGDFSFIQSDQNNLPIKGSQKRNQNMSKDEEYISNQVKIRYQNKFNYQIIKEALTKKTNKQVLQYQVFKLYIQNRNFANQSQMQNFKQEHNKKLRQKRTNKLSQKGQSSLSLIKTTFEEKNLQQKCLSPVEG